MASIQGIRDQLKARKETINKYKSEKEKWQNNSMYSGEFKATKIAEINKHMHEEGLNYNNVINSDIKSLKKEAIQKYYEGPSDTTELMKRLVKSFEVQQLTNELIAQGQSDKTSIDSIYADAVFHLDNETPLAEAYIKTLKVLIPDNRSLDEKIEQYELNNETDVQKESRTKLNELSTIEKEFEVDILMEKAESQEISTVERVQLNNRLYELGVIL